MWRIKRRYLKCKDADVGGAGGREAERKGGGVWPLCLPPPSSSTTTMRRAVKLLRHEI